MKQAELKNLIINKLIETKEVVIDGKVCQVKLSREPRHIWTLIEKTAFLYMTRITGDSVYRMQKAVIKYFAEHPNL